jgi:hypothetical protein
MINRTIERVWGARSWILNPTCLIDALLDQVEKLSVAFVAPTQDGRLAPGEAHIEARLDLAGWGKNSARRVRAELNL